MFNVILYVKRWETVKVPVHLVLRLARFGAVGLTCALLQYAILKLLVQVDVHPTPANAIGFLVSAQLNFLLSYRFTWRDAERKEGTAMAATWLAFQTSVGIAVLINALFFHMTYNVIGFAGAVLVAGIASATYSFSASHFLILHPRSEVPG